MFKGSEYQRQVPVFSVFTLRHGRHVGAQNNSKNSPLDFDSIIMQNFSDILPLFCTPTWPPHQASENQEY